jgi:hypothetical protein
MGQRVSLEAFPAAHAPRVAIKPCGHLRHIGTCAACQRAQLARWNMQLADAQGRPWRSN